MNIPPDFESQAALRIEGGPEVPGSLERAQSILEAHQGGSRYDALQDAFGARKDESDPLVGWDAENIAEVLRGTLGLAEDFAEEYDRMSATERQEAFPDPTVSSLVAYWAQHGRLS